MSDDGFHPFHARCQLSAECTVALLSPRKSDVREAKEMSDGFLLVADTGKGGCLEWICGRASSYCHQCLSLLLPKSA